MNTEPATIEIRLATCALVIPMKDLGLIRMNSTRNRTIPVNIK